MTPVVLESEDHQRDAAFMKAMHGKTVDQRLSFLALLGKDHNARKASMDQYFGFWEDKNGRVFTPEDENQERMDSYATLTRHYYNLATDIYESAWSQSFHFCRFYEGENFHQAIARHEHYLAHRMGLRENMKVLDVGCGVGGPAREITRFAGVDIVGLNNNDYQIERAKRYAKIAGIKHKQTFVKGDFMQMSFEPNSFDAVYAIEATVHAPSLEGVYSQIFRVLKPGGIFGLYEWVMTEDFDDSNSEHRKIAHNIAIGTGIPRMVKASEALRAIKSAGFELEYEDDLAERGDAIPWYYPLAGELKYVRSISDLFTVFRLTRFGRGAVHRFVGALEMVGLAPQGTQKTANLLATSSDALEEGGKKHLFTPMYMMLARKPLDA